MPIRVLIADDNPETREHLKKLFEATEDIVVAGEAANGQEAVDFSGKNSPDIVLMDINMPVKNGVEATEEITSLYPNVSVIMISVQDEPEYLRKSMNAGAKDYIIKPFNPLELVSNIRKVYNREHKKTRQMASKARKTGKVVTFFSTKGGCGKTTLLINIAIALKQKFPALRVAIFDLKLQFGDIALMMNLKNPTTVFDLVSTENFDPMQIDEYLSKHESGVSVLACPEKPQHADSIDIDFIHNLVSTSKEKYDYIFIDTSSIIREIELCILDETSDGHLILVLTPEVTALKDTRETMLILEDLGYPLDKISVILNRGDKNLVLTIDDIEKTLATRIDVIIPSEGEITVQALNRGVPFMISHSGSRIAKSIYESLQKLFQLSLREEEEGFLDKIKKMVR
ncbi:MAG: response regulator [Candidatus Wallbacteria bacterium]|nr:response regulator [Candidatus Wallbacteria bacterium]